MNFSRVGKILSINLKYNLLPNLAAAAAIALLTPITFNITGLNEKEASLPMEMILCFTGVFLMTPIFYPEQNKAVRDLIRSKKTGYLSVCIMRTLCSAAALAAIVGIFVLVMRLCESDVSWRHFTGGYASALLLGSIGFAAAGVSGNVIAGYMASAIYYTASMALGKKLGCASIFSMSLGMDINAKYYCLVLSIAIFAVGFTAVYIKDAAA